MMHVTTLLIVLALTGSPVAHVICASWCDSRMTTAGHTCGDNIAHPMSMVMSDGSGTCVALLAANPFTQEEGRISFHPPHSLGLLHAVDTSLTGGSRPAYGRSDGKANDGRPVPTLVLRL